MLKLDNTTPFPAAHALFTDPRGERCLSVALKATFVLPAPGEAVKPAETQLPVLSSDEFFGDPAKTSVRYPADLVMDKPATDIGLVGCAYSPEDKPATRFAAILKVGPVRKAIIITGERRWEKNLIGIPTMTDPRPLTSLPLRYEYAYGGEDREETYTPNPIGTGFVKDRKAAHGMKLPNIEDPKHLITKYSQRPPAAGFGFMAPVFESRLKYAGTWDEAWRREQFPLPPPDFDSRFYNAAHPDLVAPGYLQGDEPVQLINVSRKGAPAFHLPRLEFSLACRFPHVLIRTKLNIWTVTFEPDEERFSITWGASFDTKGRAEQLRGIKIEAREENT